uniref:Uncharacterized protein n=1 Tax=Romanomermis culicivorax TaxID=13658 RepID=A0A915HS19_ROMCU
MELSCTSSSDFRYQNDLNSKIALHMQMSAITNSRTFRLFLILFVYSIVGAAIFLSLESKHEKEFVEKRRNWIDRKRAELQYKIFSQNYSKSGSSVLKNNREKAMNFSRFRDELRSNMWKNRTRDILIWYENLMDNLRMFDGNALTSEFHPTDQHIFWTFRNSIVFCLTIFSTTVLSIMFLNKT